MYLELLAKILTNKIYEDVKPHIDLAEISEIQKIIEQLKKEKIFFEFNS